MAVYAISLAFCNENIMLRSLQAFYATRNPDLDLVEHLIVDQHYPLNYGTVWSALREFEKIFPKVRVVDPGRNLGLHHGFNWAMKQLALRPEDIVIGYDLDSMPITPGWDMALVRAIEARQADTQEVVWSSLANPRTVSDIHARGFDRAKADGYLDLWLTRTAITNSVCAWRYGWLESVGFLEEPRAFYGHLEAAMFGKLGKGRRWAVLPSWGELDDLRALHDREYVVYKWLHSHTGEWPGDFESYVRAGCPGGREAAPLVIP